MEVFMEIGGNDDKYEKIKQKKKAKIAIRMGKNVGLIEELIDHKSNKKFLKLTKTGKKLLILIKPFVNDIKLLNNTDIEIINCLKKIEKQKIQFAKLEESLTFSKKTVKKHIDLLLYLKFIINSVAKYIELTMKGKQFSKNMEKISNILYKRSNFRHGLPLIHYEILHNLIEAGILHVLRHEEMGRTTITNVCKILLLPKDTIRRVVKRMHKKQFLDLSSDNKIISSNNLTEQYQLTLDIIIISDFLSREKNRSIPRVRGLILKHLQKLIET